MDVSHLINCAIRQVVCALQVCSVKCERVNMAILSLSFAFMREEESFTGKFSINQNAKNLQPLRIRLSATRTLARIYEEKKKVDCIISHEIFQLSTSHTLNDHKSKLSREKRDSFSVSQSHVCARDWSFWCEAARQFTFDLCSISYIYINLSSLAHIL